MRHVGPFHWRLLRATFVLGDMTYENLASEYGVSVVTLRRRGQSEEWVKWRKIEHGDLPDPRIGEAGKKRIAALLNFIIDRFAEQKGVKRDVVLLAYELYKLRHSSRAVIDEETRERVYWLTGGACFYCGGELGVAWHVDHFKPRSKGGQDDLGNYVPACAHCNESKGSRMPTGEEREKLGRLQNGYNELGSDKTGIRESGSEFEAIG